MIYAEYINLANRTEPPYAPIRERLAFTHPDPDLVRGLHASMGLATEAAELAESWMNADRRFSRLDKVHFIEELGDICWYEAILGSMFPDHDLMEDLLVVETSRSKRGRITELILEITNHAGRITDQFKRAIFYDACLDLTKILDSRQNITEHVRELGHLLDVSLTYIREVNIAKLRKRFPEGFSEGDAVNRDLPTERKTLEGRS